MSNTILPDVPAWVIDLHTAGRHPGTVQLAQWFAYEHLRDEKGKAVSASFAALAITLTEQLPDGPELSAGLRKLLEAKDCAVRAAIGGFHFEEAR